MGVEWGGGQGEDGVRLSSMKEVRQLGQMGGVA